MAITAPMKQSEFSGFLPRNLAEPFFDVARRSSVVQQLVRKVQMGINGTSTPIVTTRPTANWVAEGATKPATVGALALKNIDPKKIAAIHVVSDEVVRANPGGYMQEMTTSIGEAIAIAFDYAALHNLGGDGTGTGPFATYIDQTTKAVEFGGNSQAAGGVYADLVDGVQEVISDGPDSIHKFRATGFAFTPLIEIRLRKATDTTGQPLWTELPTATEPSALTTSGNLLGRRSFMGEGVSNASGSIAGYVGDWSEAVWGSIGGISYSASNQATVTINGSLVSLWENNLIAVKAEAEFGFLVNDADAFVQFRNDTGS